MSNKDLEYQLRIEIKAQLSKVTNANSPNVYNAIYNKNGSLDLHGYGRIESKLIQKIIAGQLTPAAAIPQLEQELDLM
jgi:ABC-type glycerol-3-phosphate transport system substrate-binding protein